MPLNLDPSSSSVSAKPGTDLWRKPSTPAVESHDIPTVLNEKPIKTSDFRSARVTVSAAWTRLYDQGGLVIIWPSKENKEGSADHSSPLSSPPNAWIKTGIEFHDERANLSTVATPSASSSDWSLLPLDTHSATIVIEREEKVPASGEYGPSLWVYLIDSVSGKRTAVREITWAFGPDVLDEDMFVGIYAARPTKSNGKEGDDEELTVQFADYLLNVQP